MNLGEGRTRCFWLEPTGTYRVGLRRFTFIEGDAHGHDSELVSDIELPVTYGVLGDDPDGMRTLAPVPPESIPARDDERWPVFCQGCGELLPNGDTEWQAFEAIGYVRGDTGETVWTRHVMGKGFAGALFDAPWLHEYERMWGKKFVGSDGIALVAVCPDGSPWQVDGEASGSGHWSRTGDPRVPETLTVTPSINVVGSYHGFLQNGWFTEHIG